MTGRYIPQVGDRVRHEEWDAGCWCDVLAIDGGDIFARTELGDAEVWTMGDGWRKVEAPTPLPDAWFNTYATSGYETRQMADGWANDDRIAVVHIWTDADGNDHADIERCPL